MAYDTKELFEKAKDVIVKHKLFFVEDIVAFLPCSKPTFYEHFPIDSNEINELKELLELKTKLLNEIEYREGVLRQLTFDSSREKGFVSTFLKGFLKHKKQAPNLFWKDGETYGRYLIDADKELHKDIALAFEKSIEKLKRDYNDSVLEADA